MDQLAFHQLQHYSYRLDRWHDPQFDRHERCVDLAESRHRCLARDCCVDVTGDHPQDERLWLVDGFRRGFRGRVRRRSHREWGGLLRISRGLLCPYNPFLNKSSTILLVLPRFEQPCELEILICLKNYPFGQRENDHKSTVDEPNINSFRRFE